MKPIEKDPPKWSVPSEPEGRVTVSRNGSSEDFGLVVPEKSAMLAFFNEMYRRWKMWQMLDNAVKKFETGEVVYKNAADNLEHLLKEREKLGERAVSAARSLWGFTDAAKDEEKIKRVEELFDPHGTAFIEMATRCCEVVLVGSTDRGN